MRIGTFPGQTPKKILKWFANIDSLPPGPVRDKAVSIYLHWTNGRKLTGLQKKWLIVNKVAIDMERKEG